MREYESIFIINPGADENSINKIVDEAQNFIKSNGYDIKKIELWGRKKLSYNVKGYDDGFFVFLKLESDPNFITQLSRFYQLSESIIKYINVKPHSQAKPLAVVDQPTRDIKEEKEAEDEENEEDEEDELSN